jgi:hypothetical protein
MLLELLSLLLKVSGESIVYVIEHGENGWELKVLALVKGFCNYLSGSTALLFFFRDILNSDVVKELS